MGAEPDVATRVHYNPEMLLAGDVGGTRTRLGLFEAGESRPVAREHQSYETKAFASFIDILDAFLRDVGRSVTLDAVAVGVAGPVVDARASLTNVHWDIALHDIGARLHAPRVAQLNDLEAMATSIPALAASELVALQEGVADESGAAVVIAAGTGLGEAYMHRVNGKRRPLASEGGHADFAARTDREAELVRMLRERYGRAQVEHVLSGPGLVNLHRFTHRGGQCTVVDELEADAAPARITQGALSGRCQFCVEALGMFVSAFGAEAGNLALRGVATAGVFVGGGIAPKILRALRQGAFMEAFVAKAPMDSLLARMPVHVIVHADAGLLGAAVHAQDLVRSMPPLNGSPTGGAKSA
jgi:glucokinase